jgi:hypothetical protein
MCSVYFSSNNYRISNNALVMTAMAVTASRRRLLPGQYMYMYIIYINEENRTKEISIHTYQLALVFITYLLKLLKSASVFTEPGSMF